MDAKPSTNLLCKTWVHAHEDDTPGVTVYRSSDVSLPPSRGRSSMQLRPDGRLDTAAPGPTDRTARAEGGTWSLNRDRLSLTLPSGVRRNLCVKALTPDKLVVADA